MKCLLWAALITSVSLVLASVDTLCAGVVLTETSTASGPTGETSSLDRTVYVQGNKQKVESAGVTTITDLDSSIIYIIDNKDRAYTEVPLHALGSSGLDDARDETIPLNNTRDETIQLNNTGETRVIADYPCNEYRASEGSKLERATISACVSTSAPGAKELSEFERKMAARLGGRESERLNGHDSAIVMLEKQSVVSFRVPDLSQHQADRTASLLAKTRVNKIQVKTLSAATFKPPKGFSKLQHRPGSNPEGCLS
jgi:hypothetical protein